MTVRFLILMAVAGALSVALAMKISNPESHAHQAEDVDVVSSKEIARIRDLQKELREFDLSGEDPATPPEFDVQVEVDQSSEKNRLNFYVSEAHGYYVETLRLLVWFTEEPEMTDAESPLAFEHYMDKYIPAGKVLKECIEVVPAELRHVDGDIGTSDNWAARVVYYHRARLEDRKPPIERSARSCD